MTVGMPWSGLLQVLAFVEYGGQETKHRVCGCQKGDPIRKPGPQEGDPFRGVSLVDCTILLCEKEPQALAGVSPLVEASSHNRRVECSIPSLGSYDPRLDACGRQLIDGCLSH